MDRQRVETAGRPGQRAQGGANTNGQDRLIERVPKPNRFCKGSLAEDRNGPINRGGWAVEALLLPAFRDIFAFLLPVLRPEWAEEAEGI